MELSKGDLIFIRRGLSELLSLDIPKESKEGVIELKKRLRQEEIGDLFDPKKLVEKITLNLNKQREEHEKKESEILIENRLEEETIFQVKINRLTGEFDLVKQNLSQLEQAGFELFLQTYCNTSKQTRIEIMREEYFLEDGEEE